MNKRKPLFFTAIGFLFLVAAICSVVVVIGLLNGCKAFEGPGIHQGYAHVNDTFIAAVQVLITAKQSGDITQEEWNETIYPLIDSGNKLLRQYDAIRKGGQDGTNILLQVQEVLKTLQPYIIRVLPHPDNPS